MNAKKDCELCKGTGWYGDSGASRNMYNWEVHPCECTEVKPQMKTYEIIFSGICSICKHLKFYGGYSFSCEITQKRCEEDLCPIIKKLKEVKNGQA